MVGPTAMQMDHQQQIQQQEEEEDRMDAPEGQPEEERGGEGEEAEEEPFNLEDIPVALRSCVVEKLTYYQYKLFKICSRFSTEMSELLPPSVMLPAFIHTVIITPIITVCKINEEDPVGVPEETMRRNISFICNSLIVHGEIGQDVIHRRLLKADIVTAHDSSPEFVGEILEMTDGSALNVPPREGGTTREFLACKGIQKLKALSLNGANGATDVDLLKTKCVSLVLIGDTEITVFGIAAFIRQWERGERKIYQVLLAVKNFTMEDIAKNVLNGKKIAERESLCFCRSEDHSDCLEMKMGDDKLCIFEMEQCPFQNAAQKEAEGAAKNNKPSGALQAVKSWFRRFANPR